MVLIAFVILAQFLISMYSALQGNFVWSMVTTTPSFHSIVLKAVASLVSYT
jgi:hypothetical protein